MFTITITRTIVEEVAGGQNWEVVGKKENGDPEYGHTPAITKKKAVERKLYEQTVDKLDIRSVINAVNDTKGA